MNPHEHLTETAEILNTDTDDAVDITSEQLETIAKISRISYAAGFSMLTFAFAQ